MEENSYFSYGIITEAENKETYHFYTTKRNGYKNTYTFIKLEQKKQTLKCRKKNKIQKIQRSS